MNGPGSLRRAVAALSGILEHLAGWMLLFVACGVTANAIARYGFGADLALITEMGGFVFLIVTFLGLAGTYIAGQHVAVEVLEVIGSRRFVRLMQGYVIPVVSVAFMVVLVVMTTIMTLRYFNNGRVTLGSYPVPFWILMAVIPLGSIVFLLVQLSDLVSRLRGHAPLAGGDHFMPASPMADPAPQEADPAPQEKE